MDCRCIFQFPLHTYIPCALAPTVAKNPLFAPVVAVAVALAPALAASFGCDGKQPEPRESAVQVPFSPGGGGGGGVLSSSWAPGRPSLSSSLES